MRKQKAKNNNIPIPNDVVILNDYTKTGKERPWAIKKEYNMKLAEIYKGIDYNKTVRLEECGNFLEFTVNDNEIKLNRANFCRVRLCPICQWRRSLKVFSQMTKIFKELNNKYSVICLNLTVENCIGEKLNETLETMSNAFHRMLDYKKIKDVILGYYRSTEITHNLNKNDKSYNTYHPHFHCLLIVENNYFKSKNYLKQTEIISLWKKALKVNYEPTVFIRKLYINDGQDITSALAEVTKYTIKEGDMITGNYDMDIETVSLLDKALNKKRFICLGGILKEIHKKLNLKELENDNDLIHIDDDEELLSIPKEEQQKIFFVWNSGYKQYIKK